MNLQQNLELCTPVSIQCSPINQVKKSALPEYVLLQEPNWFINNAIMDLHEIYGVHSNFLKFLQILLKYRNPKNEAKVFISVAKLQKKLGGLSRRTIQGYIRRAEELGYVYIEDCVIMENGKPRYTSSRYYFTSLILDPANESLQIEIAAKPPRKSRQAALSKKGNISGFQEPTAVSHNPVQTPPRAEFCAITIQVPDSSKHQSPTLNLNTETPKTAKRETPVPVVEDRAGFRALRLIQARKIIAKYNRLFRRASQTQRQTFIATYIKGSQTYEEMIGAIDKLHGAKGLRETTKSPNRLFKMGSVIPEWNKVVRKIKDIRERDRGGMAMERIMADEHIAWFYCKGIRPAEYGQLGDIMMNNVVEITSEVYL